MEEIQKLLTTVSDLKFIGLSFNQTISQENYNGDVFYIVGNDDEAVIGINQSYLKVYSISDEDIVFMNSSFEKLIKCIYFFNENIDLFEEGFDEKKRKKEVKVVTKGIKEIDKEALIGEEFWWSLILEQTEDGLL